MEDEIMLDQKIFGEKLRNHRKNLGFTQEYVAEKIGVSAQAISKWEAGECLPDCFNLKAISDVYSLSADVLLDTQNSGDINSVAGKIEQLGTEFVWANCKDRYGKNLHKELGADLWQMWKGLFFIETGDREKQKEAKAHGNTRICGSYGTKIWDDAGVAAVVRADLIKSLPEASESIAEAIKEIASADGTRLISTLNCEKAMAKSEIIEKTGIELHRLNELLLLFTENRIIDFVSEPRYAAKGYKISGHCGIAAYMVLAAMHVLGKHNYTVSEYFSWGEE
ncbi:MAG: helix-turn-helix transcriptional regulator [Ruminococcaceae bacterium]|nr:helix-turn-helix transcriptional regulator [Oscillospiraceae bacterium]